MYGLSGVEKFIKGSKWRTGEPMKVRGTDIPEGSLFEVAYSRRRDQETVAVKFVDEFRFYDLRKINHRPVRRRYKGRWSKADEMVPAIQLSKSVLVEYPEGHGEYFIREIDTGNIWGRAIRQNSPSMHGKQYISVPNALVGLVSILFKKQITNMDTKPLVEIIGFNPITHEEIGVTPINPAWWSLVLRMALASANAALVCRSTRQRMQAFMGMLPMDISPDMDTIVQGPVMRDKLTEIGIEYHHGNYMIFLMSNHDSVLTKIMFPDITIIGI